MDKDDGNSTMEDLDLASLVNDPVKYEERSLQLLEIAKQARSEICGIQQEITSSSDPEQRQELYKKRGEVAKKIHFFWGRALLCHPDAKTLRKTDEWQLIRYCLDKLEVSELKDGILGFRLIVLLYN